MKDHCVGCPQSTVRILNTKLEKEIHILPFSTKRKLTLPSWKKVMTNKQDSVLESTEHKEKFLIWMPQTAIQDPHKA